MDLLIDADAREMARLQRSCLKGYRDHCIREAVECAAVEVESHDSELQELRRQFDEKALYDPEQTAAACAARSKVLREQIERTVRHQEWVRVQHRRITQLKRTGEANLTAAERQELQERETAQLADLAARLEHRITQRGRALCGEQPGPTQDLPPCFNTIDIVHADTLTAEHYAQAIATTLRLHFATVTVTVLSPPAGGVGAGLPQQAEGMFDRIIDGKSDCGIIVECSGLAASTVDAEQDWPGIRPVLATSVDDVLRARRVNDANVVVLGVKRVTESEACRMADALVETVMEGRYVA
eukprot:TRINITY_DN66061_c0_g1_i1.p1 TRINITY_DN66061_c0_g1~~TRINITY_DN66061_c0_g1_i1.p1  ORF type:complete len:298 (+),score=86.49 TRINITY_DN66061_c0_g1_i1:80-973(+)